MSDFKAKMHRIRFRLGLRPRPRWGSLQRPQTPCLNLRGLLLREGREGKEEATRGEGMKGEGERREGREEGKGIEGGEWRGEEAFLVM